MEDNGRRDGGTSRRPAPSGADRQAGDYDSGVRAQGLGCVAPHPPAVTSWLHPLLWEVKRGHPGSVGAD